MECNPQFILQATTKQTPKEVTEASLESCKISAISSLVSFSNLMKLSITRNNLESISLGLLPQSLQILNVSFNKITSITIAPMAQLKVLILNHNSLTSVPHNLPPTLKALVLSNNPLGRIKLDPLPLLTKLSISSCSLTELPCLAGFDSLKQVNANNNAIINLIEFPPNIEIIELANNNLSCIEKVLGLENLKNLNIKGNSVTKEDYELLKEKLSLRVLDTVRIDSRYHERRDSIKKTRLEKIQKAIGAIAKEIRRVKKNGDKKTLVNFLKEIKELEEQRDKMGGIEKGSRGIKKARKLEAIAKDTKVDAKETKVDAKDTKVDAKDTKVEEASSFVRKKEVKESAWETGEGLKEADKVQPITVSKIKHTGVVKVVEKKGKGVGVPFDVQALEKSMEVGGWND